MYGSSSRVSIKKGLVIPSHRAELFIGNISFSGTSQRRGGQRLTVDFQSRDAIEKILSTPAGRIVSAAQRKFIEGGNALYRYGSLGDEVADHFRFWVYAVSRDDVEKTTQAFIQFLIVEAEANMQYWLSECDRISRELIPDTEKRIAETLGSIKTTEAKLAKLKKTVLYVSTEEAIQTVLEFNGTLDALEVEIAGLRAKVAANKEYMREYTDHASLREETFAMLQQILGNDTIELAGALARMQAAAKIRDRAKEYYDLHTQLDELPNTLKNLENSKSSLEEGLKGAEERMADPYSGVRPPKIFENEVFINPIDAD
jgi:hypothetical protein